MEAAVERLPEQKLEQPEQAQPAAEAEESWWSAPCGPAEVLAIALPMIVSTGAWTVQNFIDRMFLFGHSVAEGAAALPSGMLFFTLLCFPLGVVSYLNTFIAQYGGAGHPERIGRVVWQGVWIGIACVPVFVLVGLAGLPIFLAAGHNEPTAALEAEYFRIVMYCAGANIVGAAFSAFFSGRGDTLTVMRVSILGAAANVVLDWVMIFGHFGVPEMGMAGAAWATVIADWLKVLLFAMLAFTPEHRAAYRLDSDWEIELPLLTRILMYGGPSGLNMLIEVSAFTLFLMLMGQLGQNAMAATNMAFTVNSMAFVPMMGLGIALSILVGRELGRNRVDLAWRATWNSLALSIFYTGGFAIAYINLPDLFLIGHALQMKPEEFGELRDITVVLLRFVAAYCLLDALSLVFANALKGAGDTTFVMIATLIVGSLGVGVGWYGLAYLHFGLIECWWVITLWITAMGLTFAARFLQGAWQEMRVIEPELQEK
jgi:MATE family multidrug resistance protein